MQQARALLFSFGVLAAVAQKMAPTTPLAAVVAAVVMWKSGSRLVH
jgi:hypothetical protein